MIITTKKYWPIYIPPKKDELFSSWFVRLCYEHKIKSYTFSKFYFKNQPIWNRDIDKLFPLKIKNALKNETFLNDDEVRNMFLISYNGIIYNNSNYRNQYYTPGLLNIGIYHRKRKQYGLLCCPSCLSNDIPYYRKAWRIAFSLGCSKCKCHLIDHCPKCNSEISFHRLETGQGNKILRPPLFICWKCEYDLRDAKKKYKKGLKIDKYQLFVDNTIRKGYNEITNYSFTYFYVLGLLSKHLITTCKTKSRIKIATERKFNVKFPDLLNKKQFLDLSERKTALLYAFELLDNWPSNFLDTFINTNVRACDFKPGKNPLPFWFVSVLKQLR